MKKPRRNWPAKKRRKVKIVDPRLKDLMERVTGPARPGDPRRHHFIPHFMLRNFAQSDGQIAVFSVREKTHRMRHVSDTAVMKDLYTIVDKEHGESLSVEKILAESDGQAAAVIDHLVETGLSISAEQRGNLAMWISLLHVRGPHLRRELEALVDQTYKLDLSLAANREAARARLRRNLRRTPTESEIDELVEAATDLESFEIVPHQNDLVKRMLDLSTFIFPHLLQRHLALFRLEDPGLILSDRPLVLYQKPENRHRQMGVGIANADELWLPLDRSTALILHADDRVGDIEVDSMFLNVDDFNQAVAFNADAELYAHPEDVSRVDPLEMPQTNRPLMQVSGGWVVTGTDGINEAPKRRRHRRYKKPNPEDLTPGTRL